MQRVLLYTHHSCYESADRTMLWLWQSTEVVGGHRVFHHTAHSVIWSVFSQFVSQLLAVLLSFTLFSLDISQPLATTYPSLVFNIAQPLASTYPSLVL
jgi:hypothetical protein